MFIREKEVAAEHVESGWHEGVSGGVDVQPAAATVVSDVGEQYSARRPILLATRPGFFARLMLRSPIFDALQRSGVPLQILWGASEDEPLQQELRDAHVRVGRLHGSRPASFFGRMIERTFRSIRAYTYPKKYGSAKQDYDRMRQDRRVQVSSSIVTRAQWLVTLAAIFCAKRFTTVRKTLLTAEALACGTDFYRDLFEQERPGVVVTGTPGYGPWSADAYLIREARRREIPTVCMVLSWDNLSTKGYLGALPDYFLVWSERMKHDLVTLQDVPAERITVTGTPMFDLYSEYRHCEQKRKLVDEFGLDPDRKIILIGTNSPVSSCHNATVVEMLVDGILAERFKCPVQFIVRPHPLVAKKEGHVEIERLQALCRRSEWVHLAVPPVIPGKELDFPWSSVADTARLVCGSDMVVNLFSTLQLEAALADRPIVNVAFDPGPVPPNKLSLSEMESYHHLARIVATNGVRLARSENQLFEQINYYLQDPDHDSEGRMQIVAQECGPIDGCAAKRIADFLIEKTVEKPRRDRCKR